MGMPGQHGIALYNCGDCQRPYKVAEAGWLAEKWATAPEMPVKAMVICVWQGLNCPQWPVQKATCLQQQRPLAAIAQATRLQGQPLKGTCRTNASMCTLAMCCLSLQGLLRVCRTEQTWVVWEEI